ncbi:MAG: hypothetical protein ACOCWL_02610 [Thermoguttaceae bacterium]
MSRITTCFPVRALRRRWKPHKERLAAVGGEQATSIRFHRVCSRMARVEQMPDGEDDDLAPVSLWIAFNALDGQWDAQRREPRLDRESWRAFVHRILGLDRTGYVPDALRKYQRLVISLLDDHYLSGFFWQEPFGQTGRAIAESGVQCTHVVHRAALGQGARRSAGAGVPRALPACPRDRNLRR